MVGTELSSRLAVLLLVACASGRIAVSEDRAPLPKPASAYADVRPRALARIAPGTVIGDRAPKGWTNLVLLAAPRLGAGDFQNVAKSTADYTSMFSFATLANVRNAGSAEKPAYFLEKVAIGTVLEIGGRKVVIDGDKTFGQDLGFVGRRVLAEHESILQSEFRQVARTRTMTVFDAKAIILFNKKHSRMIMRHAVVVSPTDGSLATFVWLLGSDGKGGYALAEKTLQRLPENLHEDRVLSVDSRKFTLGVPASDAFALIRIPQGTAIEFTPELHSAAVQKGFTAEGTLDLEAALQSWRNVNATVDPGSRAGNKRGASGRPTLSHKLPT